MAAGVRSVRISPFSRLPRLDGVSQTIEAQKYPQYKIRDLSGRACLRMIVAGRPPWAERGARFVTRILLGAQ